MDLRKTFGLSLALAVTLSCLAQAQGSKKPGEDILANTAALTFKYQDYAEAIAAYQRLLDIYPKARLAKDYTYNLAMSFERTGDYQRAAEMYQKVVTTYKGTSSEIKGIDSLAMDGVGRCFNKNFKEYAVVVDGAPITKLEVDAELEKVPPFYRTQFESEDGRKKFLDQLVEKRLLLAEAKRRGIVNNPDIVQRLEDLRTNVLIRGLIDQEVTQKSQPAEAEIKKYYKDHLKDYLTPEQAKARQIVVKTRAEADRVYKEAAAKKAQSFDSLAMKHSIDPNAKTGGDLGLLNKGQRPELDAALFKTPKGKLAKPVPAEPRFAVVKLVGKEGKKLQLRWILLNTEEDAAKALGELKADAGKFDSLVAKSSVDISTKDKLGNLGLVAKGEVEETVFQAASKLKPGAIAPKPVKVYTKYVVLKVEERIAAGMKSLDQAKAQIAGTISKERQKALYEGFLKDIKAKAKIEYPAEPAPQESAPKPEKKDK